MPTLSPEFALNVLAIFLGGGTVQLLIFLFRRRAEIRQVNTTSDSVQVNAAMDLVSKHQQDGEAFREMIKSQDAKVSRLEARYDTAQLEFTQQLRDAHAENVRLTTRVAQLQTDLDIATRQIADLRARLP